MNKQVVEIIPSRSWKNKRTGQSASIYGAVPYWSEAEKAEWEVITEGYTWKRRNGTVGLCRPAAKTYQEAVEVMNSVNREIFCYE